MVYLVQRQKVDLGPEKRLVYLELEKPIEKTHLERSFIIVADAG